MFQYFDLDKLRNLVETKDAKAVAQYVEQVSKPHPFSLFFKFDQGPVFRLAGIPIESRFYLFGNATIARGLFKYSPVSGLGAPASAFPSVMGKKGRGSTSMSPAPSSASFRNSRPPAFPRSWTSK
jgi:hypothetical protein